MLYNEKGFSKNLKNFIVFIDFSNCWPEQVELDT